MSEKNRIYQILLFVISLSGLLSVYLFQKNITSALTTLDFSRYELFAATKIARFLLNDFFMILLIHALFFNKRYTLFAFYTQLFGIVFLLIPYLIIKYYYISYNGPLISYLHRLIINPLLMLLLIPALIYKKRQKH